MTMLLFNPIYNMKDSWETYPYEEHERYTTSDRKIRKYYAVWRDRIGWRCAEVTEVQHEVFRKLTTILGHAHMMDKGMNVLNVTKRFGKPTIRSMIKKGIFRVHETRLWLTSNRLPSDDPFIENGLREDGKVFRREQK